jgi:RND family efflux transporter MFP subunit
MAEYRHLPNAIVALALVVCAALFGGCDQQSANADAAKKAAGPPPPPAVTVSQPRVEELVEWDEYTARFDAVEAVDIRARVSGYLTEVAFKDGQNVKKGDLLYVIDARPFERALDQAKAELEQAKTKSENANLDVERGRPLMERKILSEKAYDDRANLLRDAQAAIKVAEAKVATAELEIAFTRVTAPIAGRTGRSQVTAGNWVSAGSAANATLLTSIVSQNPIHVYFDVSENNYLKYKRLTEKGEAGATDSGALIEIALPDEVGFPHKGKLDFLDNRLDPGTATVRARAEVANDNLLFSPGMFARVRIPGSAKYKAFLLPDAAIGTDQASKFVLVVDAENTVSRKAVKLGPLHGNLRVVRSGISAEDWVVTKGVQRARPGQKVAGKREPLAFGPAVDSGAPPGRSAPN